jgi:MAE_28990/MAE_18760-like HEPN
MTAAFLSDFEDRRRQVRHYLAIVLTVERMVGLGASRAQERRLLTLRAGTFLLVYNLIEATTRGAIEAIHDKITTEKVPFNQLALGLRKEVVRRFKLDANPSLHHTMDDFPSEFVAIAFDQGVKLAGNVDAKFIRELGECYGFSYQTANERTWAGSDLLTIKSNRNKLAHGRQTFEEVGRDYPSRELLALTRRSLSFMNEILINISDYLERRDYIHTITALTGATANVIQEDVAAAT